MKKFNKPTLITLTGPSCSGKTTLHSAMMDTTYFSNPVSFTTRAQRPGEVEGRDYYFTTRDAASRADKLEENEFLGNLYGMYKAELTKKILSDTPPVLIVDINGVHNYEKVCNRNGWDILKVYVHTQEDELLARLERRRDLEIAAGSLPLSTIDEVHKRRVNSLLTEECRWLFQARWDAIVSGTNIPLAKAYIDCAIDLKNQRTYL